MSLQDLFEIVEKGGSGSGNFGHGGIKGKRGGSTPGGGKGSIGGGDTSSQDVPDWLSGLETIKPSSSKPGKGLSVTADTEKGLKSPKTKAELKSAVGKLKGSGDLRESIGEVLKKNGYKYETSGQSGNGGFDMYYRGQFNISVIHENNKTRSELSEQ